MDDLDVLARVGADVDYDPAALIRVRRRVLRRALLRSGAARGRRRVRVIAAIAVACALVISLPLFFSGGPAASPAAAAVLDRAAEVAAAKRAPDAGEYLHVRSVTTRWYDGEAETTTQERWIPGDRTTPTYFRDFEGFLYQRTDEPPAIYLDQTSTRDDLLAWLRRPNGDLRDDEAAYERIGEILVSNAAPLDFQARLFDVLQYIDGVDVVAEDEPFGPGTATIIGRSQPLEVQFAFDQTSGLLLGIQGAGNPETTHALTYRTVFRSTVVERLPRRATQEPSAGP